MADSLSAKTQEHMRVLCHKISVAHALDPEIQEELYGHMEDKLLAYVKGEEPLTEEDAFILVREHFGDPAVLKGLLQDVHAHAVHVTLSRRIAAVLTAETGLLVLQQVLHASVAMLLVMWAASVGSSANLHALRNLCAICLHAGAMVFLWIILRRWQRKIDEGRRLWFLRWHPLFIIALVALFVIFMRVMPDVRTAPGVLGDGANVAEPLVWRWISAGAWLFAVVLPPVVWLWWCDRPPRQVRALVYGFLGWFVFRLTMISSVVVFLLPRFALYIGQLDPGRFTVSSPFSRLAYGRILESPFYWKLSFEPLGSYAPGTALLFGSYHLMELAWHTLIVGAVAVLLYALAQYVRRRRALRPAASLTEVRDG